MGRVVVFFLLLSPPLILSPHHTYFHVQHSMLVDCSAIKSSSFVQMKWNVFVYCVSTTIGFIDISLEYRAQTRQTQEVVIYLLYQYNTSFERSSHTCSIYSTLLYTKYIQNDGKKGNSKEWRKGDSTFPLHRSKNCVPKNNNQFLTQCSGRLNRMRGTFDSVFCIHICRIKGVRQ